MDADALRSASHSHQIQQLVGPLAAGTRDTSIGLDASGRARADFHAREPLLLVGTRTALGSTPISILVTVTPDGGASLPPVRLDFAPFTEAGAFLPVWRPVVPPETHTAPPFSVTLSLPPSGALPPKTTWTDAFDVRVVEGVAGRLLYLMGAEKARIRRQARELEAGRIIAQAWGDALDRYGAELGVPRFESRLKYDPPTQTFLTETAHEDDVAYRRRLRLYRPFVRPTRAWSLSLLNGGGTGSNAGLLGEMGLTARFDVAESDIELAVAILLVDGSTAGVHKKAYLDYLRAVQLVAPAADAPTTRLLSSAQRAAENQLRQRLRAAYAWPANANVAPLLARTLDRVAKCRAALGGTGTWTITRAQDDGGGSRYELGLGVAVAPPAAAELDALAAKLPAALASSKLDAETRALLAAMTPRASKDDPGGRWFFEPCGMKTVHFSDPSTLYLSHFPMRGMLVASGPGNPVPLSAFYYADGDNWPNVVLYDALADATRAWAAAGGAPWTELTPLQLGAVLGSVVPPSATAAAALGAAGLNVMTTAQAVTLAVQQIQAVPRELIVALRLDAGQASRLVANQSGESARLETLLGILKTAGVVSVMPLVTSGGDVLIVTSVLALDSAGAVFSHKRATGFRWYRAPLWGFGGSFGKRIGSRTTFEPLGLSAVVVCGYARAGRDDPRGGLDPYDVQVSMPDGAVLTVEQYEFVMNLLERTHPMGVVVDTSVIRQAHVDLDGDGKPDPLSPLLSRTYRPFRQPRQLGVGGSTSNDS